MLSTHALYLRDLGYLLREAAEAAGRDVGSATEEGDRVFQQGRRMAYYEVLSLMHQQALAFDLPLQDLALEGLDPERDLI
jgi:hypothetical protein